MVGHVPLGLLSRAARSFWMYWGASLNWSVFAIVFAVLAAGYPEEVASVRRVISGRGSAARSATFRGRRILTQ